MALTCQVFAQPLPCLVVTSGKAQPLYVSNPLPFSSATNWRKPCTPLKGLKPFTFSSTCAGASSSGYHPIPSLALFLSLQQGVPYSAQVTKNMGVAVPGGIRVTDQVLCQCRAGLIKGLRHRRAGHRHARHAVVRAVRVLFYKGLFIYKNYINK